MKRLYRDKSNEMIAGVCSGIAEYLDVDATIIRLIFVLFAFVGGGGLWIYLVLWVIMPVKPGYENTVIKVEEKKPPEKEVKAVKAPAAEKPPAKKTPTKKTATKKSAATKTAAKKSPAKPKPAPPKTDDKEIKE